MLGYPNNTGQFALKSKKCPIQIVKMIDFLASKNGKSYLFQVAYSVVDEIAYSREFGVFANLDNSNQKILITNDVIDYSSSTVRHIKLEDFLMMKEL